jgi:hypothetical protein
MAEVGEKKPFNFLLAVKLTVIAAIVGAVGVIIYKLTKTQKKSKVLDATDSLAGKPTDAQGVLPDKTIEDAFITKFLAYQKKGGKLTAGAYAMSADVQPNYNTLNANVDKVYDAKSAVARTFDHTDQAIGVFRSLYSQYEINALKKRFQINKGRDLLEYLKTFLTEDDMNSLNGIISSKPAA